MKKAATSNLARFDTQSLAEGEIKKFWGQRDLDLKRIRRIAASWDWDAARLVTVAFWTGPDFTGPNGVHYQTGDYIELDGQNTVEAMRQSGQDMLDIPCRVVLVDDKHRLVQLFIRLNDNLKSLTDWEQWPNELELGDPIAIGIDNLAKSYGLSVAKNHSLNQMSSITTLKALATTKHKGSYAFTPVLLDPIFAIITGWWNTDNFTAKAVDGRVEASFLNAWAYYLKRRLHVDGSMPSAKSVINLMKNRGIKVGGAKASVPLTPQQVDAEYRRLKSQGTYADTSSTKWKAYADIIGKALHGGAWASRYSR